LIYSLAYTSNELIFKQKSVRAFIDFIWPKSRSLIIKNCLFPYLAFILYYLVFLIVMKKLMITQQNDPAFFTFSSDMFLIYDFMFKFILFLMCFYFAQHDLQQIKNVTGNRIVLWSYVNIVPLIFIFFIVIYDTVASSSPRMEKTFYSLSAFFIWVRVVHLMKCFSQTSYLLRMGSEILYRMRYLITFILISLFAFGFTFYFLDDSSQLTPQ
jgi:hypothetical protein